MSRYKEPQHQKEFIKTCVRIKPILQTNEQKVLFFQDSQTIVSKTGAKFTYNHVFDEKSSTDYVYEIAARPIIQQSLKGFNGCIMAYGQTCSGKTHTMKGTIEFPGIVPLALSDIFDTMKNEGIQAKVQVSYMEIYNQRVFDLLSDSDAEIQILSNQNNLIFTGLNIHWVENFEQAIGYFNKGQEKRKFGSNNVNLNSSRSHTIFRININVLFDTFEELNAQIDLVDLAGSQGIDRTKNQKLAKTEGENINKSLLALSRIITLLSQKRDDKAISFRDSKLTRILQKSLCENAKSSIICMINPIESNLQESLNTLKFGQNALKIKIEARQNINRTVQAIKQPYLGRMTFLPSEKIELEQARATLKQNQIYIKELNDKITELYHLNYKQETDVSLAQQQLYKTEEELKICKEKHSSELNEWQKYKQLLVNRIQNHEGQIERLEKMYEQVKQELRIVQKNQKYLVESLAQSENLCMHLNNQIKDIKNQMNQENSKLNKIKPPKEPLFRDKPNPQQKRNPFHLPPYKHDPNHQRIQPNKLAWIFRLKNEVIELNRKVQEYSKANIEIAEEVEQLRQKNDELQDRLEKKEVTGKINPESLEYKEIKRLKKKVGSLKEQLRLAQINEKKYRDILKKDSTRNLIEMEEYEEWYEKKYGGNILMESETQTDIFELLGQDIQRMPVIIARFQEVEPSGQKMQIEERPNPFMRAAVVVSPSPTKSEVLNRNRGQAFNKDYRSKNDNPESHQKQKNMRITFGQDLVEYENNDVLIDQVQNIHGQSSLSDSDSMLLSRTPKKPDSVQPQSQFLTKIQNTRSQNVNISTMNQANVSNMNQRNGFRTNEGNLSTINQRNDFKTNEGNGFRTNQGNSLKTNEGNQPQNMYKQNNLRKIFANNHDDEADKDQKDIEI